MSATQATPAAKPGPSAAIDWPAALRDAGFATLITFGLCIPIVALKTVQNMSNVLVLEPRWSLVAWACAVVFFGKLALTAFQARPRAAPVVKAGPGPFDALRPYLAPAFLGFIAVYPLLALATVGPGGSIKWIDNFGIQILIYIMLGWGLNIVVGLAGLLDLGYVAFYAVGAYSYALLATKVIPEVFPSLGLWAFWVCLPVAGILAAFWGILLGFPVLRLRGDYLAIVTLAFGEIIRLVLINWIDFSNGYAGISSIPRADLLRHPVQCVGQRLRRRVRARVQPDLPHDLPLLRHPGARPPHRRRHRAVAPTAGGARLGGAARG